MKKGLRRMYLAFLSPVVIAFLIAYLYPVLRTVQMSFFEVSDISAARDTWEFVGLYNYVDLFSRQLFRVSFKNMMLIFLAGLQSISPAIYEACRIDGATAWETFWKITFPMISPMILVNAVYTIIDSFTTDSNSVMKYIQTVYTSSGGMVRSSAMAWMYFLLVMLILALLGGIFSAFVFYQKRDA